MAAPCAAVLGVWWEGVDAQRPQPEVYGVFDVDTICTLLPPDGIPAIRYPQYVTAAADSQMSPEEPVLAMVLDGKAVFGAERDVEMENRAPGAGKVA